MGGVGVRGDEGKSHCTLGSMGLDNGVKLSVYYR